MFSAEGNLHHLGDVFVYLLEYIEVKFSGQDRFLNYV